MSYIYGNSVTMSLSYVCAFDKSTKQAIRPAGWELCLDGAWTVRCLSGVGTVQVKGLYGTRTVRCLSCVRTVWCLDGVRSGGVCTVKGLDSVWILVSETKHVDRRTDNRIRLIMNDVRLSQRFIS